MSLCKPTIRHGAKYRLLKRCIPVSTSSQHPATAASWRNGPPILNCPAPHANAAFVKTAAFGLKRIAVNRWCFVNCWIVGCGRCRIGSATRQSLKKESTESSSSTTRTIGQSEKRAAPFRKPAKCERKTICLSERGNKPIAADTLLLTPTLYPTEVNEYASGEEMRLERTYCLSPTDDPASIPVGDFDREGWHYTLLDVTRQENSKSDGKD